MPEDLPDTTSTPSSVSAFGAALLSPSRTGSSRGAPVAGDALDATFDKLTLEARLFPGDDQSRPSIIVGEFRILERLGLGGMGAVYRAHSERLQRDVALKKLNDLGDDPDHVRRLLQEARCLARVNHPNVVHIHECPPQLPWRVVDPEGLAGPMPSGLTSVIVMEYLEGSSLRGWLAAAPRSWRQIVAVLVQAAHGLAAAHACGLLHGDLTLGNIVVTRQGVAKLVDFGLARPQADETPAPPWAPRIALDEACGTPGYIAPEQLAPGTIDARTDLFSLCVVAWEALCRTLPYPRDSLSPRTAADASPTLAPDLRAWPAGAPAWLRDLLLRGLALDPAERPPSVGDFTATIERRLTPERRAWIPWSMAATATVVGALFAAQRPDFPPPLSRDDPGLAQIFDPGRRARIAGLEKMAPGLPARVDQFARVWEDARASARDLHDPDLREQASICLLEQRWSFGQVLSAMESSAAVTPDLSQRWFFELSPPDACANPVALRRMHRPGWFEAAITDVATERYERGLGHLLRGELEPAELHLQAARLHTSDPDLRGRASRRLAEVAMQRGDLDTAAKMLDEARRDLADDDLMAVYVDEQLAYLAQLRGEPHQVLALHRIAHERLRRLGTAEGPREIEADLASQAAWALLELHEREESAMCPFECSGCDSVACAGRLLAAAARSTPDAPGPRARLHYNQALLARARGDMAAALASALAAGDLDGDPDRPSANTPAILQLVGDLRQNSGDSAGAAVEIRRALEALTHRGLDRSRAALPLLLRLANLEAEHPDAVRRLELDVLAIVASPALPTAHVSTAIELYDALATAWIDAPAPDLGRGLELADRGLDLARRHRSHLKHRTRVFVASMCLLTARTVAGRGRAGEASARADEGLGWLPGDGDLTADPELQGFAADVRNGLREFAVRS